jgi:hypothetical protein
MTANDKPAPRWYSFRLWQLFAVMTVLCVFLAWQMSVVRARNDMIRELRASGVQVITVSQLEEGAAPYNVILTARNGLATIPLTRRLLGDEAVQRISYYPYVGITPERKAQIERTFPEATVVQDEPPLIPCHPGCFPHGTLVETPSGPRKIEEIAVRDEVYIISEIGEKKSVPVLSIFRTTNRLWEVSTSRGLLVTTETQPLCVSLREHVPAGKLQAGDTILMWTNEQLQETKVAGIRRTERTVPVINLVLGDREPFVANNFLARSKPPEE